MDLKVQVLDHYRQLGGHYPPASDTIKITTEEKDEEDHFQEGYFIYTFEGNDTQLHDYLEIWAYNLIKSLQQIKSPGDWEAKTDDLYAEYQTFLILALQVQETWISDGVTANWVALGDKYSD